MSRVVAWDYAVPGTRRKAADRANPTAAAGCSLTLINLSEYMIEASTLLGVITIRLEMNTNKKKKTSRFMRILCDH